jgi:hypothetical protein
MISQDKPPLKYPDQKEFEGELKTYCRGLTDDQRKEIVERIYNSSFSDLEKRTFPRDWKKFMIGSPFVLKLLANKQLFFTQS